ncbi:hypothetical protein [Pararhizobium gei]|uniref:hypothetical protein n=1 Tax=Pararhizobium gei TaxID=1395951 RepID=UPI0023DA825A|nr:hypothetical protein [Rhizobium gei]
MRKLIIASIVAASAALSFAAPSQAGGYYGGHSGGYYDGGYQQVDHYYGHKRHYKKTYHQPTCWDQKGPQVRLLRQSRRQAHQGLRLIRSSPIHCQPQSRRLPAGFSASVPERQRPHGQEHYQDFTSRNVIKA